MNCCCTYSHLYRIVLRTKTCSVPLNAGVQLMSTWKTGRTASQKEPLHGSSSMLKNNELENLRQSKFSRNREAAEQDGTEKIEFPQQLRHSHPEFLPSPLIHRRDHIVEKLERMDMYKRRHVIRLPEFYVGSVLAVTVADEHAAGKKNRFVGICIDRAGTGLAAYFVLRNVVDGQGVEVRYDLYSPVVMEIQVLQLEKRLDESLYYLRDCPQEYSTFPFNMEVVPHVKGSPVPVNNIKVPLNPRPWSQRWERANLNGVQPFELKEKLKRLRDRPQVKEEWKKYDIMLKYRNEINDDEAKEIITEVYKEEKKQRMQSAKLGQK